jgi:hypothetical protein
MPNYTPYEILFGRKANIPECLQQRSIPSYNYDLIHIKRKLQECHEIAKYNLTETKQKRIENQNENVYLPLFWEGCSFVKNRKTWQTWSSLVVALNVFRSRSKGIQ